MKLTKIIQKTFIFFVTFILIMATVFTVSGSVQVAHADAESIDLASAYKIALTEAKKWNSNAKTYFASSTDSDYSDVSQGIDGTRKAWTFVFVIENPDTCFNVFIKNGKIDHTQEVVSAFNKDLVLPEGELKISSQEAVGIVREEGLLPSENWAVGYHFALKNVDGELCLTVIGSNENKEMKRINVNASTSVPYVPTSSVSEASIQEAAAETAAEANVQQFVFEQNATAYLSLPGKKTASGKTPAIGMVAVHPNKYSPDVATAVKSGPIIPFGTVLTIQSTSSLKYVTMPATGTKQWTQFTVEDIGQTNRQQGYSTWWIDIYFGLDDSGTTKINYDAAIKFDKNKRISYSFWAPFKIY